MLRVDSRNINFNATCLVGGDVLASFNASVNDPDNNIYVNVNISNSDRARTNATVLKTDLTEFIEEILKDPSDDDN